MNTNKLPENFVCSYRMNEEFLLLLQEAFALN